MAKYEVFQAIKPNFGFCGSDPRWPEAYRHVADVEAEDLDEVFALTNTGDCVWTQNVGVQCIVPSRSTSVGDVIVGPDGRAYRCESLGWSEIPE